MLYVFWVKVGVLVASADCFLLIAMIVVSGTLSTPVVVTSGDKVLSSTMMAVLTDVGRVVVVVKGVVNDEEELVLFSSTMSAFSPL